MPLTRTLLGKTLPGQPCPKFHLQTISDGSWAPFHSHFRHRAGAATTPADTRKDPGQNRSAMAEAVDLAVASGLLYQGWHGLPRRNVINSWLLGEEQTANTNNPSSRVSWQDFYCSLRNKHRSPRGALSLLE
jgi:hypothetical protein